MGDAKIPIMNGNRPDVNQDVQAQINHLVQWKDKRVDVVRQTLKEAIHRVKRVTCEWSGNLPDVMRLMYALIHQSVMKASVNPVDKHVSEKEEGNHTENELNPAIRELSYVIIQLAVTS